jgi:hypothetical protein
MNSILPCVRNAMMRIIGKGLEFWKGCLAAFLVNGTKEHGNIANQHAFKYDIHNDLTEFFISMEQYMEPIATLVVCLKTE